MSHTQTHETKGSTPKTFSDDISTFGTGSKENTVNFAGKRAVPKLNDSQARELQILNRIGHFVPT